MKNFAVIGVGGFVAPRHLAAIRDTGNRLVAATDPSDSVGVLDRFSFDVRFFQEIERFDRFAGKNQVGVMDRIESTTIDRDLLQFSQRLNAQCSTLN